MPGFRGTPDVMTTTSEPAVVGIVAAANQPRIRSLNRVGLEHIECQPGGLLIGDVDDHDIRQLFDGNRPRDRGTHIARATDDSHFTVHSHS